MLLVSLACIKTFSLVTLSFQLIFDLYILHRIHIYVTLGNLFNYTFITVILLICTCACLFLYCRICGRW